MSTKYQVNPISAAHRGAFCGREALFNLFAVCLVSLTVWGTSANAIAEAKSGAGIVPTIGHSSRITTLAHAWKGNWMVTGSDDQTAKIWDTASASELRTLVGHSAAIMAVAISPNDQEVVTASLDKTIRIWRVSTGKQRLVLQGHSQAVFSLAIDKTGRFLLSGSADGTARLWRMSDGKILKTIDQKGAVSAVAVAPSGSVFAIGSGTDKSSVTLWERNGDTPVRRFGSSGGYIRSIAFSPDGRFLAFGDENGSGKVIDARSYSVIKPLSDHKSSIVKVAYTSGGEEYATASWDRTVKFWDTSGKLIRTLEFYDAPNGNREIQSIAFNSMPDQILIAFSDGSSELWDWRKSKRLSLFRGHAIVATALLMIGDNKRVRIGYGDKSTYDWDLSEGRPLKIYPTLESNEETSFLPKIKAFVPGNNLAITANVLHNTALWNINNGAMILEIPDTYSLSSHPFKTISTNTSGSTILDCEHDRKAFLWRIPIGEVVRSFEGHKYALATCQISRDGGMALTGSWDKSAKLWDAASGKLLHTFVGHNDTVSSLAFGPENKLVASGSLDHSAIIWSVTSKDRIASLEGHDGAVTAIKFSANGQEVLTGSSDTLAILWSAADGLKLNTLSGHSSEIDHVFFGSDNLTVVTSSKDGTTKIWRRSDGKQLVSLIAFKDGEWIAITPEGFFNASEGGAKYLNVVRELEAFPIERVYDALYRPDLVKEALAGDPRGLVKAAGEKLNLDEIVETGLPPRLKIVSPDYGSEAKASEVTVEIEMEARSGGIGRIEWRVNGSTQGVLSRGFESIKAEEGAKADPAKPQIVRLKQRLYLLPGRNTIDVIAYNSANLIASNPARINLTLEKEKVVPPKLFVLAVGIDDYWDSQLKLRYAVSDAQSFASAFKKAGKGLYRNVTIRTVLNEAVTKDGLASAFAELSETVRPNDVFVFYLAGHGKTHEGRYYFIPRNFRYRGVNSFKTGGIGQDLWQSWFATIKARKSLLLYDTCESGTLTGDQGTRGLEKVAALERLTRAMGRTVLTAATDTAPALEGYRGHGVFTYTLLDALANADGDKNQQIEVTELAAYIDRALPELSFKAFGYRQVPQMKIVGNSFPLVRPTQVLAAGATAIIPKSHTHVVIKPVQLRDAASDAAAILQKLVAGTQIRVISTANGWALVARGGRKLGYIESSAVVSLQ